MIEWRPKWAGDHVRGRYPAPERDERGLLEPVLVEMDCGKCGAHHQVRCESGLYHDHISRFAHVHAHADELHEPRRG